MTVGFPRPKAAWTKMVRNRAGNYEPKLVKMLPIPWIGEVSRKNGVLAGWTEFDDKRCRAGHSRRLCQVCGGKVPAGLIVHLLIRGGEDGYPARTSGCGMHVKCALLALKVCPHFDRMDAERPYVAWVWGGRGQGYHTGRDYVDGGLDWDEIVGGEPTMLEDAELLTLQQLKDLCKT